MDHYSRNNFKKSLVYFFVGKFFNGAAGFLYLLIIVRNLKQEEYGIYIGLISLVEIVYLLSSFGLTSFLHRYIPEYRVKCQNNVLRSVVYKIFKFRLFSIIVFIFVIVLIGGNVLHFFNITLNDKMFFLFSLYLSGEMVCRTQMDVFSVLLLQGYQQLILFLKNMIKLLSISYFTFYQGSLNIEKLFIAESLQVCISLIVSFVLMTVYFSQPNTKENNKEWVPKNKKVMAVYSFNSYLAQILSLLYSQSALNLLIARFLGLSEVAIFGFAQSIIDLVRKYMPTYLLLGMIRPIFIARYTKNNDSDEISMMATLLLKINIYILSFLMVIAHFFANDVVAFMTDGKYVNISTLLITLLALLVLRSFHLVLNIVLATYEKGKEQIIATLISTSGMLVSLMLWEFYGLYGIVAGAFSCEVLWAFIILTGLKKSGVQFNINMVGVIKIIFSALIVSLVYSLYLDVFVDSNKIIEIAILMVLFIGIINIVNGFNSREQSLLLGFFKR